MGFSASFLAIISLCSIVAASPIVGRQAAPENSTIANLIAQCAPNPFIIQQFTTFSGSDTASPQISFFFINENGVDVKEGVVAGPVFCSAILPKYSDVMNDYSVYSCQNGTGFRFDTKSVLTVSQSMLCDSIWPGAPTWALANGTIDTTSQSGIDGGIYNTPTQLNTYLDVVDIVESIPIGVQGLPTCGQMCVSAELNLGASFGCSPSNYTCLCASSRFTTALRDCLISSCNSNDETQVSTDYFNEYCAGSGVLPATPSPLMTSSQ